MRLTQRITIHYAGFGLTCSYGSLAWASRLELGISLGFFYAILACAVIVYLRLLYRMPSRPTLAAVFGWGVVFRLSGFVGNPLFEDDFYRYLWDGYRLMTDGNPYPKAPETFFKDPAVPPTLQLILGNINYPEMATVYGPGLQFLFGLAYWLAPVELWPLKALLIGFDLILIGLLARIGKTENVLLYAWNPMVIKEIAFTAHPDGLIPLLLISAWLCQRQGWLYWMAVITAIAVTLKIPALLTVPFLLWRRGWKPMLLFAVTLLFCYLPFIGENGSDLPRLMRFAQDWQFNSALYRILVYFLPDSIARFVLGLSVIVWVYWLWRHQDRLALTSLPRGDLVFAGLIFAAPAINSWYWLWVLPFGVAYPCRWIWISSCALLLSYITGINLQSDVLQAYQQPIWVPWVEFGIVTAAIIAEYRSPEKISSSHLVPKEVS